MLSPVTLRATARGSGAAASTTTRLSQPLALETWPHRGAEGRDVLLDRVASMSFVAALGEEPRAQLLAEVADLLETHPDTRGREDVALPYVTELFTTRASRPGCRERQPGSTSSRRV